MLDENISWEQHIQTVEAKLAKNIRLLDRAKPLLEENLLKVFILRLFIYT